jgi:hypothetical protein
MRRVIACSVAAGLLISQQAAAEMHCLPPSARAAFDVQALRSEMMVLATGCSDDSQYNAFIERYRPALMANEQEMDSWFKRNFGRRAQTEHDRFVTDLANAQSSAGTQMGTEFCPHNGVIFQEVMALGASEDLAAFAAGQNLVPASLNVCSEETAEAPKKPVRPVRKVAERRK